MANNDKSENLIIGSLVKVRIFFLIDLVSEEERACVRACVRAFVYAYACVLVSIYVRAWEHVRV